MKEIQPKIIVIIPSDENTIKKGWLMWFLEREPAWIKTTLVLFNFSIINSLTLLIGEFPTYQPIAIITGSSFLFSAFFRLFLHFEYSRPLKKRSPHYQIQLGLRLHLAIASDPDLRNRVRFLIIPGIDSLSDGLDQFIQANSRELDRRTYFLEIGPVTSGFPDFIHSHGILKKHQLGGELYFHLEKVSRRFPWKAGGQNWTKGHREVEILRNRGFEACCIAAVPASDGTEDTKQANEHMFWFMKSVIEELVKP
jgi:hypothetical protein